MYLKPRFIVLLSLAIILSACFHSHDKLSFTPLTILFRTDTLGQGNRQSITRFEEYLVDNYSDNIEAEKQIDSFAFKNVSPDVGKYTSFQMVFYKKTSRTNLEAIKDYKNWIPPESLNDMIYNYWWDRGKFLVRYKFRNGKIVDPPEHINVINVSKHSTKN
jgi:hypothetical protein